jgi:uncharacterized protein YcbK (DUF882 family)
MQLTLNFHLIEFACHDGTPVPDEMLDDVHELAANLQVLRYHLGAGIYIISGYRTPAHNKKVGGAKTSQHLKAKAADIMSKDFTPKQIYNRIEKLIEAKKMKQGGLGLYKTWVHYDTRGTRARWKG